MIWICACTSSLGLPYLHVNLLSAKNTVQRLIKEKKKKLFSKKLEENIGEPKELWKNLKKLGLPKTKTPPKNICLKENDGLSFCPLSIANNFKEFFQILHKT